MDLQSSAWYSAVFAVVLCLVNVFVGYFVARFAIVKPWESFVGLVLGGMVARVAILGALVWYFVTQIGVHTLSFTMTLGVGSFLFIFVEIIYFHHVSDKISR